MLAGSHAGLQGYKMVWETCQGNHLCNIPATLLDNEENNIPTPVQCEATYYCGIGRLLRRHETVVIGDVENLLKEVGLTMLPPTATNITCTIKKRLDQIKSPARLT